MSEFDENKTFPESGNIPESESVPEYISADEPLMQQDTNEEVAAEISAKPIEETPAEEALAESETAAENAATDTQEYSQQTPPVNTYSPTKGGVPYQPYANCYGGYNQVAYAPRPPKKKKYTGIIVFAIILAVVMVAAVALSVIYAMFNIVNADVSNPNDYTPSVSTELYDRPNDDDIDAAEVYDQVVDSVVLIQVYSKVDTSTGSQASGVVYSEDGYIVTNDHIYDGIPDPQFLVTTADGRQFDASFVAGDSRTDLAVLKIETSDLTPAQFGNSDQCIVGEEVVTVGNPGGSTFNFSLTDGIISAVDRWAANNSNYSMRFIQIDAAINSGNSGGALANMYGQVVGITTWKYVGDNFENIGFAIPSSTVIRICDSLISNGYVAGRAKLGLSYQEIDAVSARLNDIDSTGLLVAEITPGTSFASSGIAVGDLITHMNGVKITDSTVVLAMLEDYAPGATVSLTVLRSNGTTFEASVVLGEDRGTSSYSLESDSNDDNSIYGGEFNFPDGE